MELHEATLADIQKENPQLLKDLSESIKKDLKASDETTKKDQELKEANAKIAELEKKDKLSVQNGKIEAWLKEAKTLPAVTKTRIASDMGTTLYENDVKLREAFEAKLKTELEYVSQFSKTGKISMGSTETKDTNIVESAQADLEKRFGIAEPKKEEKEKE